MFSILIVIIGISLLILIHELGHFAAAKYFGIPVEEFGIGFPPRLVSKKMGETRYSINWLPLGGFVKLHGEFSGDDPKSFVNQKAWRRAVVLVAGVTMNFFVGWLLLSMVFFIGAPTYVLVDSIVPGSPAARADIKTGDRILDIPSSAALIAFTKSHQNQEVTFKVLRQEGNQLKEVAVRVAIGDSLGVYISDVGFPAQSLPTAIKKGLTTSFFIMGSILTALTGIFSAPQNFVGPIGIFSIAIETGKLGIVYILQLLALISLNLAILNLLPVPALDGGRLLFILIEKIRGKAFSAVAEIRANTIGFVVLIGLIILVTIKDLVGLL